MSEFGLLFILSLTLIGLPLLLLALLHRHRQQKSGCTGNHDCVVYKGEKVQCPACELRDSDSE